MMNLKQMSAFREVMLTGSVSEAARNLNRTQPSISHMISGLEDELGMRLFERQRGRLHPVPEAQYLFKECIDVLNRISSVSQNMQRMKAMESGELKIVSMPGPATVILPELICQHLGAKPEVKATLLSRSSDAVQQLVGSQQFDLGIADHDPARTIEASLVSAETFLFNCICAIPAGDALAELSVITPADLTGKPMATLFTEHRSHLLTRRAFEAEGQSLNVRFVGQFFHPLLTYVEQEFACAIIDPLTAESWLSRSAKRESIVFRPFEPAIEFGIDLLTPAYRPASILAASFAERLIEVFMKIGARRRQLDSSALPVS